MRALQILSLAMAFGSHITLLLIGNSITREVNEALGTEYKGIWRFNGNKVLKEHERLFPASRKRVAHTAALAGVIGFLLAAALFGSME